ncbi:hypothetical protein WOLCODRAFT_163874 [Wolfiporia cocos MD-104 SS10]|uniref:Uncharacterized protein n=1 Tax=Wolfiporia cocos (strain MD-104) TaxID=742152 RepID=A0A2H3JRL7_WOLCO|nr:hypothetical protein WOLCODRAFT_163874 [Wolfiporia cocos MD-104 SS10]
MWRQSASSEYSTLFSSGLCVITSSNHGRPLSMMAGPSSPLDAESHHSSKKKSHSRTASTPHCHQHAQSALPRVETNVSARDTSKNGHSAPRTASSTTKTKAARKQPQCLDSSIRSWLDDEYRDRDIDQTDSYLNLKTENNRGSPLTGTSFLSFNVSPTESVVSLVPPSRQRRASIQTVPLPPRQSSATRKKRRSVMSVDLSLFAFDRQGGQSPALASKAFDEVIGWNEELPSDWRQGADSPFQDDRSFLITSY